MGRSPGRGAALPGARRADALGRVPELSRRPRNWMGRLPAGARAPAHARGGGRDAAGRPAEASRPRGLDAGRGARAGGAHVGRHGRTGFGDGGAPSMEHCTVGNPGEPRGVGPQPLGRMAPRALRLADRRAARDDRDAAVRLGRPDRLTHGGGGAPARAPRRSHRSLSTVPARALRRGRGLDQRPRGRPGRGALQRLGGQRTRERGLSGVADLLVGWGISGAGAARGGRGGPSRGGRRLPSGSQSHRSGQRAALRPGGRTLSRSGAAGGWGGGDRGGAAPARDPLLLSARAAVQPRSQRRARPPHPGAAPARRRDGGGRRSAVGAQSGGMAGGDRAPVPGRSLPRPLPRRSVVAPAPGRARRAPARLKRRTVRVAVGAGTGDEPGWRPAVDRVEGAVRVLSRPRHGGAVRLLPVVDRDLRHARVPHHRGSGRAHRGGVGRTGGPGRGWLLPRGAGRDGPARAARGIRPSPVPRRCPPECLGRGAGGNRAVRGLDPVSIVPSAVDARAGDRQPRGLARLVAVRDRIPESSRRGHPRHFDSAAGRRYGGAAPRRRAPDRLRGAGGCGVVARARAYGRARARAPHPAAARGLRAGRERQPRGPALVRSARRIRLRVRGLQPHGAAAPARTPRPGPHDAAHPGHRGGVGERSDRVRTGRRGDARERSRRGVPGQADPGRRAARGDRRSRRRGGGVGAHVFPRRPARGGVRVPDRSPPDPRASAPHQPARNHGRGRDEPRGRDRRAACRTGARLGRNGSAGCPRGEEPAHADQALDPAYPEGLGGPASGFRRHPVAQRGSDAGRDRPPRIDRIVVLPARCAGCGGRGEARAGRPGAGGRRGADPL